MQYNFCYIKNHSVSTYARAIARDNEAAAVLLNKRIGRVFLMHQDTKKGKENWERKIGKENRERKSGKKIGKENRERNLGKKSGKKFVKESWLFREIISGNS